MLVVLLILICLAFSSLFLLFNIITTAVMIRGGSGYWIAREGGRFEHRGFGLVLFRFATFSFWCLFAVLCFCLSCRADAYDG